MRLRSWRYFLEELTLCTAIWGTPQQITAARVTAEGMDKKGRKLVRRAVHEYLQFRFLRSEGQITGRRKLLKAGRELIVAHLDIDHLDALLIEQEPKAFHHFEVVKFSVDFEKIDMLDSLEDVIEPP